MKILWIAPITGTDPARLEHLKDLLRRYAFQETEVTVRRVTRGAESIESRLDEVYAAPAILDEVRKGEKEGFDACIIGCAGDAGVAVAKDVARIPVIGPLEASISLAQILGRRFVFLWTLPERIRSVEERVARFLPRADFFIYPTHIPVLEMAKDVEKTVAILVKIIKKSIEQDGADTAVLGCLSMRGMAEPVQAEVKIPVIDPSLAALTVAQSLVQIKLTQSKGAYPFPHEKKRFL
jgi:allantoin racemase